MSTLAAAIAASFLLTTPAPAGAPSKCLSAPCVAAPDPGRSPDRMPFEPPERPAPGCLSCDRGEAAAPEPELGSAPGLSERDR
jgi:hypothetical protein